MPCLACITCFLVILVPRRTHHTHLVPNQNSILVPFGCLLVPFGCLCGFVIVLTSQQCGVDPCIVFGHGSKPNWTYGHRIERIRTLYPLWAWIKAKISVTHDLVFWMTVSIIRNQVCHIIIREQKSSTQ